MWWMWLGVDVVLAWFAAFVFWVFARIYAQLGDRPAVAVCWVSLAVGVSPLVAHAWAPPWWRYCAVGITVVLALGLFGWENRRRRLGSSTR